MAPKSQSSRSSRSSRGGKGPVIRSSPTARTTTAPRGGGGSGRNGAGRTAAVTKARAGSASAQGRAAQDRPTRGGPAGVAEAPSSSKLAATWLQWVTLALAVVGLAVSAYLTYTHFSEAKILGCSESGLVNCQKVTTSSESYVFGIPVAVLGLAFYAFLVPVMTPYAWRLNPYSGLGSRAGWTRWVAEHLGIIRMASLVVGVGFVLYLLYAELYMIGSICLYCTSVHIITFLLFVAAACAAAAWGLRPRQETDAED